MNIEFWHYGWLAFSVAACLGAFTLAGMKHAASKRSTDRFTRRFLCLTCYVFVLIGLEVICAEYQAFRMPLAAIPLDAAVTGFIGRAVEGIGFWIVIAFLIKGSK